ncbi:MAG: low specificity L-threonine aldolase [Thermomicrobiales bacterium]|nr:low specificity L-threonine aldolase [Thermomicrobiales bacterium]
MIDLSSDTSTRPSQAMREFMAAAPVGDEQLREDPTVNELQDYTAELTGKEAGLFVPSGTMCNAIAYAVHARPGEAVILDRTAHPNIAEGGGPAVLAGLLLRTVDGTRGVYDREQAARFVHAGNTHASRTALISVENTANMGGGMIWPLETLAGLRDLANEQGMKMHMDGARLMNAVVGSGNSAATFGSYVDTVWIDLSKGLGAPVGAVLTGSREFIEAGRLWKHRLGGAMRQAGIIAAAGLYAFRNNVDRLAEDHANARLIADRVEQTAGLELIRSPVETNIVIFSVAGTGLTAREYADRLLTEHDVRISPYYDVSVVRAVTHLDASRGDCETAAEAIAAVAENALNAA